MNAIEFTQQYLRLLQTDYKGLNLTRILQEEEFKIKQYEDSVWPLFHVEQFKNSVSQFEYIVDLGFGGGFPILPLASVLKDKKFIGVDARNKKVKAVNEIAHKMGIKNVYCLHERFENLSIDMPALICVKAVGDAAKILSLLGHVSRPCHFAFYKGPSQPKFEHEGYQVLDEMTYCLSNGDTRVMTMVENVPRGTFLKKQLTIENYKKTSLVKAIRFHFN